MSEQKTVDTTTEATSATTTCPSVKYDNDVSHTIQEADKSSHTGFERVSESSGEAVDRMENDTVEGDEQLEYSAEQGDIQSDTHTRMCLE